ncbi:aminopeptidase P family protein [Vaginisenegalia massiliensis]|uniref:aminopeptidase P family protein n=1 Tax=Vaginisenegalia massiliensis TaxID=2058294 RepID=UPI000F52EEFB|nr:aminopeptidase P family protein [Vaginisenegalia massiliensis]
MYLSRYQHLVERLNQESIDHILISDASSISYFIANHMDAGERLLLLQVNRNGHGHLYWNILFPKPSLPEDLASLIDIHYYADGETIIETIAQQLTGITSVDKFWPAQFLLALMTANPNLTYLNRTDLVDDLRAIKSPEEQAIMLEASRLNDQAMLQIQDLLSQGLSEKEMIDRLAQIYRDLGCQGFSFDPIIAYGANCADPHHETNHDTPQIGDSIVVDIGAIYQGYCSDMTRTFFFGQIDEESQTVYELVKKANQAAIDLIKPGVPFTAIDAAARDIISQAGYGQYFTHRTGHFIGRQVHEAGDVSAYNSRLTQEGQIFSIEPGIYLPGKMGVRIEDLVLVTADGCQILNQVSKELSLIEPK